MGAKSGRDAEDIPRWGFTWDNLNTSTVNVGVLGLMYNWDEDKVSLANKWTAAHELGHEFGLRRQEELTDDLHQDVYSHNGTLQSPYRCVMDYNPDYWSPLLSDHAPLNGVVEFCWDGSNHLSAVRTAPDPLQ